MGRRKKETLKKISIAEVWLWGSLIGRVAWDDKLEIAVFEYDINFLHAAVEPSPIMMPKNPEGLNVFSFPSLSKDSFKGLPGMLADSLPDKFGNALIDIWIKGQGRKSNDFSPIERLCYVGNRGMGALEYKPSSKTKISDDVEIDVSDMVKFASSILKKHKGIDLNLDLSDEIETNIALRNLLAIGTSAGGARAKCLIAYNEKTGQVRSGLVKTHEGFNYWLLKLDGVAENSDKELNDPLGFGCREYAYYLMARKCEIEMSESCLLKENGRAHFMTKRFDRLEDGAKLHMQSLCAIAHYDYNLAGGCSYEAAIDIIRKIIKTNQRRALEQQFRRAVFNVIGKNQDDHTKNIAFLMDKNGEWSLSPAFDMVYNYNPNGMWTNQHQMSLNQKRSDFTRDDFFALAAAADIKKPKAEKIIDQIVSVFKNCENIFREAGVFENHIQEIKSNLRIDI